MSRALAVSVLLIAACSSGGGGDVEPDAIDPDAPDARIDSPPANVCGNDVAELGEACDGPDLGWVNCGGTLGATGEVTCTDACEYDVSACTGGGCGDGVKEADEACDDGNTSVFDCCRECQPYGACAGAAICGNGVREGAEQCDTLDVGDTTCGDLDPAWTAGSLHCSQCRFVDTLCRNPAAYCGNNVVEAGEECDGNDGICWECRYPEWTDNEPNDTSADAEPFPSYSSEGQLRGRMETVGALDVFTVEVPALSGAHGWILTTWIGGASAGTIDLSNCGQGVDGIDSLLRVRKVGEDVDRAFDDDGGDGSCSHVRVFVEPGTYEITVTRSRLATPGLSDFTYDLFYAMSIACDSPACAETEPNNTTATATAIPSGGRAALTSATDVDVFTFGGAAGVYRIAQGLGCDRTSTIEVIAADGVTSLGSTDACGVIVRSLPAGTHYVRVRHPAGAIVPEYRLTATTLDADFVAEAEPNDTPGTGGAAVPVYRYLHGQVSAADPVDHFNLNLGGPQPIRLTGLGTGARCDNLGLRLFASGSTTPLATGLGKLDDGVCGELVVLIPSSGTYVLEVTGTAEGGAPLAYEIYTELR